MCDCVIVLALVEDCTHHLHERKEGTQSEKGLHLEAEIHLNWIERDPHTMYIQVASATR